MKSDSFFLCNKKNENSYTSSLKQHLRTKTENCKNENLINFNEEKRQKMQSYYLKKFKIHYLDKKKLIIEKYKNILSLAAIHFTEIQIPIKIFYLCLDIRKKILITIVMILLYK